MFIRICTALTVLVAAASAFADEYYISSARGKGKVGSKEEPARDLGIISDKLKPGDVVHIAAGTYYGISESGVDEVNVPVKIIGGYSDDFSKRDPWGEHKTIFTGKNKSENFKPNARLYVGTRKLKLDAKSEILVDGIIFDNGERNGYVDEKSLKITRTFMAKTKTNIAADSPGLSIDPPAGCEVLVVNCVVMNTAPHHKQGALKIYGGRSCKITVRNNLVVNNSGAGIYLNSWHQGNKDLPEFLVENNTVLFTWKYDAMSTDCGSALKTEASVIATVRDNVFGFSDAFGLDNMGRAKLTLLQDNLFCASLIAPYVEFNTKMKMERVEEESKFIDSAKGNLKGEITVPVPEEWAKNYASRVIIDRAVAEQAVEPVDNWQNQVRKMLGLPLEGTDIKETSAVWLHRLATDAGLKCGEKKYQDKYGCEKPK